MTFAPEPVVSVLPVGWRITKTFFTKAWAVRSTSTRIGRPNVARYERVAGRRRRSMNGAPKPVVKKPISVSAPTRVC